MANNAIITSKTIFWFTSRGKVARERPPGDYEAEAFRLEQLMSGEDVGVIWGWYHGYAFGMCLRIDERGRIIREIFDNFLQMELSEIAWDSPCGIVKPLPARMRKIKVVADNLLALAKMFGARYDNSLYDCA